jgi:predicted enzyme related to lactoylglutathione lyase
MGTQLKHPAGNFCWFELTTSDQKAATDFYTGLFGWSHVDNHLPDDAGVYTMLRAGDKEVGALYQPGPQQPPIPPNWMAYVAVESADQTSAKATELGGEVVVPAFDVMDHGRMAGFKDPTGAILFIWEPKTHLGADLVNAPGAACWVELMTRDAPSAKEFYTGLFGWSTKESDFMAYTEWMNAGQPIGGMFPMEGAQFEGTPPHWMIYFMVEDCDASTEKAQQLGGKVHVPPTDIPNTGRFSMIQDPQGAFFAVFKLTM